MSKNSNPAGTLLLLAFVGVVVYLLSGGDFGPKSMQKVKDFFVPKSSQEKILTQDGEGSTDYPRAGLKRLEPDQIQEANRKDLIPERDKRELGRLVDELVP